MKPFRISPEAAANISEIWEFIARDNLEAAERVRQELHDAIQGLVEIPGKGHFRERLTDQPVSFSGFTHTSSFTDPTPSPSRSSPCFTGPGTSRGYYEHATGNGGPAKLQWAVEREGKSKHEIAIKAVRQGVEREVREHFE